MGKKLSEMTLEELWQLFPIVLTEHQPCWAAWFMEEKALLERVLTPDAVISHIGSTSVSTIWAKPIVDILVETANDADFPDLKEQIQQAGYRCMSEDENRLSFNKGYTENGFAERVFHLHLRRAGDHDELYFRDYLTEHPEAAREYEEMKLRLWREFEHNRDAYTDAKTAFVRRYTELARLNYGDRYLRNQEAANER